MVVRGACWILQAQVFCTALYNDEESERELREEFNIKFCPPPNLFSESLLEIPNTWHIFPL
jgi:hypothetical protein